MNFKTKVISTILVVAVFIAVGFYFGYRKFYFPRAPELPAPEKQVAAPAPETVIKPAPDEPTRPKPETPKIFSGFRVYKNAEFGFEIQYPASWIVAEEINENVRGEMVKEFYFKKPGSDARFAILPRDGLSYGIGVKGTSTPVFIGGSPGVGTQYVLEDSRRLWLLFPQYGLNNWLQDIGRIDAMTSAADPIGDTLIFEQMLNSFKLVH